MGTSMYPVVPMEIKPKEEDVYTLNLPVNGWVAIGLSGINHSFFSFLSLFLFNAK